MRGIITIVLMGLSICIARTQTLWSGQLNSYAAVTAMREGPCATTLTIDPAIPLPSGTRILVVQMQGATFTPNEDERIDGLPNLGLAGRFTIATVDVTNGALVTLRERITIPFDVISGRVQIVTIAQAVDARLIGPIIAPRWDGRTGGIVAIEVERALTLSDDIDVSGAGFRGARLTWGIVTCHSQEITAPIGSTTASIKGEGVAVVASDAASGVGRAANGGGGGAATNTGGGGGGGGANGGRGGDQWSGCGPMALRGGRGGVGVTDAAIPRLLLGGGGGAGHQNNGAGTAGAGGGGAIYLRCALLMGSGGDLRASGASVTDQATIDGAGGGGGGGSIVLDVANVSSTVTVDLRGGNGGIVNTNQPHGPGGGGGGGSLWTTTPTLQNGLIIDRAGGRAGVVTTMPVGSDRSHGAHDGAEGVVHVGRTLPIDAIAPPSIAQLRDTVVCYGAELVVHARIQDGVRPLEIRWTDATGKVLGTESTLRSVITASTRLTVRVTDANGCTVQETMDVVVTGPARISVNAIDLGTRFALPIQLDTFVVIRNLENRPLTIRSITFSSSDVTVIRPPLPITIPPGRTQRVDIRVNSMQPTADVTMLIEATPCDSVTSTSVRWDIAIPTGSLSSVVVDVKGACRNTEIDTALRVTAGVTSGLRVTEITSDPMVTVLGTLPISVPAGGVRTIPIRIRLTDGAPWYNVRAIVVYDRSGQTDTIYATVNARATLWSVSAPDTVDVGVLASCGATPSPTPFVLVGSGTSPWRVRTVAVGSDLDASVPTGTDIVDTLHCTVATRQRPPGPFVDSMRISLGPCDTTVTIIVTGVVMPPPVLSTADTIDVGQLTLCDAEVAMRGAVSIRSSDDRMVHTIDTVEYSSAMRLVMSDATTFQGQWTASFERIVRDTGFVVETIRVRVGPCDTTLTIILRAYITRPAVTVSAHNVVVVTDGRDTTITVEMRNTGPVNIIVASVDGVLAPYRINAVRPALPAILRPGDVLQVDVGIDGDVVATTDTVEIGVTSPCSVVYRVALSAVNGGRAVVRLPHVRGAPGRRVDLAMTFDQRPPDSLVGRRFTATFTADPRHSVLSTSGPWSVERKPDITTVIVQGVWNGGDTVVTIPAQVLLAAVRTTPLLWSANGFVWGDAAVVTSTIDGSITHDSTCADRYIRFIRLDAKPLPVVRFDATTQTIHVDGGDGAQLAVHDVRGVMIHRSTLSGPQVVLQGLLPARGVYVVTVESDGYVLTLVIG